MGEGAATKKRSAGRMEGEWQSFDCNRAKHDSSQNSLKRNSR